MSSASSINSPSQILFHRLFQNKVPHIIQPILLKKLSVYLVSPQITPKRNNKPHTINIVGSVAIFLNFSSNGRLSSFIIETKLCPFLDVSNPVCLFFVTVIDFFSSISYPVFSLIFLNLSSVVNLAK